MAWLLLAAAAAGCGAPAAPTSQRAEYGVDAALRIATPPVLTTDFFGTHTARLALASAGPGGHGRSPGEPAVHWQVGDTAVAVIGADGTLRARRIGQTLVWAQAAHRRDSALVTVAAPADTGITLVAHRGYALVAPENTLPAMERAYDLGADAVEIDVVLTRDGVPVIMHDATVDRTTNGAGAVAALSAAEVRALDACSWLGAGWAPCAVPTLDEALALAARRDGRLLVHLKGRYTTGQLEDVIRRVHAAGMRDRAMVIDIDFAHLAMVRRLDPALPVGYIADTLASPERLRELGGAAALYAQRVLATLAGSSAHVRQLHAHGVATAVWTVTTPGEGEVVARSGVRRLITDLPLDRGTLAAAVR